MYQLLTVIENEEREQNGHPLLLYGPVMDKKGPESKGEPTLKKTTMFFLISDLIENC